MGTGFQGVALGVEENEKLRFFLNNIVFKSDY